MGNSYRLSSPLGPERALLGSWTSNWNYVYVVVVTIFVVDVVDATVVVVAATVVVTTVVAVIICFVVVVLKLMKESVYWGLKFVLSNTV